MKIDFGVLLLLLADVASHNTPRGSKSSCCTILRVVYCRNIQLNSKYIYIVSVQHFAVDNHNSIGPSFCKYLLLLLADVASHNTPRGSKSSCCTILRVVYCRNIQLNSKYIYIVSVQHFAVDNHNSIGPSFCKYLLSIITWLFKSRMYAMNY